MKINLKIISLVLYTTALFLPVFKVYSYPGWFALCVGALAFDNHPGMFVAWLANLPFFLSLVIRPKNIEYRLMLVAISILLGFVTLTIDEVLHNNYGIKDRTVVSFGFYFWISSFITYMFHNIILLKKSRITTKKKRH